MDEGLSGFDVFIIMWSKDAFRSNWVRRELHSVIHHSIETNVARIVPCLLDDTPLPALIRDIKGVDFSNSKEAMGNLVDDLLGFRTRRDRLIAIQRVLSEMDFEWSISPGCPPVICCPRCGNEDIEGWERLDRERESHYVGLRCRKCGWSDGGEI